MNNQRKTQEKKFGHFLFSPVSRFVTGLIRDLITAKKTLAHDIVLFIFVKILFQIFFQNEASLMGAISLHDTSQTISNCTLL